MIRKLHIRRHVDEYMQIGLIALWEAYERYDETKGSFCTFAFKMIRWRIVSQLRKETKNVYVPLPEEYVLKEDVDFCQHRMGRCAAIFNAARAHMAYSSCDRRKNVKTNCR
ncbi:sigma factor [Anoxybacillus sp. KU2-6(11)]|uniref:sigma factor n=1 Tax=Anoxybacillus sp. KU2-6(11) TaxID=1535751 RepID=UPI000ACC65EF|nr:sigma factor [Anoxybacillus sp. KU2-6(11)]